MYRQAVGLQPDYVRALSSLAETLEALGRRDEASQYRQRARLLAR